MRFSQLFLPLPVALCFGACAEAGDLPGVTTAASTGGTSSGGTSTSGGAGGSGAVPSTGGVSSGTGGGSTGTGGNVASGDASVDSGQTDVDAGTPWAGCSSHAECDDSDVCTDDICRGDGVCFYQPQNVGTPCDDGLACTSGDLCVAGACKGSNNCTDGRGCSTTSGECITCSSDADCDDSDQCTTDFCGGNGCENIKMNSGSCDDGFACTTDDTCSNGECVATVADASKCNDTLDCTIDTCDLVTGCANTPADPLCDDGNPCTSGSCLVNGDGGGGCEQANTSGDCSLTSVCFDNHRCDLGVCIGDDTCSGGEYCSSPDNRCVECVGDGECDDGFACTADSCVNFACVYVTDDSACADSEFCSTDTCVAGQGCVYTNNNGLCDDGATCTPSSYCENQVCVGDGDPCSASGGSCRDDSDGCRRPLFVGFEADYGNFVANDHEEEDVVELLIELEFLTAEKAVTETRYFDGDSHFSGEEKISAFYKFSDGRIVLSTTSDGSIAGLSYQARDLVLVSADRTSASILFDGSVVFKDCGAFGCSRPGSVDAVHMIDADTFVFSANDDGEFVSPNITFNDGDILLSDAGVVSVLYSDGTIGNTGDIAAITVNPDTQHWALSYTSDSGGFSGGSSFKEEDLIELAYGPGDATPTGVYKRIFQGAQMTDFGTDLVAAHID